jgi:transglutaminase-like putative cysteine protease
VGAHDVARKLFAKLVEWAPNRAEAWAGLADEIAATPDAQADTAAAAALRRARELAPAEARYREELALRSRATPEGEDHGDEHYLVSSQTILARRKGVPTGLPDVSARDLHFLRAVIMHADHRVSMLIHYAREIVIAPRTEGELYEEMPIEEDLTEILRARVHRKDGGTAFPAEEHNEGGRPRIRWPMLQPGDVVEVALREWTRGAVGGRGDVPFYFMDFGGAVASHPTLYNEVDVETLPDRPLYLDVLNGGDYQRTEKDENGHHVTRLVWEHPVNIADEPLAPNQTELVPVTVGSTFKTWGDFRAWYGEAVKGFTDPDEEVRRLAAELTKGKATRDQKLAAIFDFVSDDIRYVNYTSGEWWLPNRPQQLLARREGDCDDKAMLLITLLKAVGIDAQQVMVQTRMTGQPTPVLAKNAVVPMFDHGIAFLPGANGGTYLDATSPQSRLGPLPSMDAKALALRMDSGPAEIIHLPASNPADHGSTVNWTITLKGDGSGDLAGEEHHVGDGAFWLRTALSQADSRLNYVESNLVGGWFPTVVVDRNIEFKGDLPHGEAWVKYRAKSDGLARHEEGELVVPITRTMTLASQIAPLQTRTLPVQLPPYLAPSHETRTIRIVAPAGWAWSDLPPGGDENGGDFGRAHLDIARDPRDPRVVVVTRSVSFDLDRIPVARYAAWRAWVQRTDALMHKAVRLVKEQTK